MSTVMTGARAQFSIGNQKIATASNVSWSEEIAYEPINVLDKLEVEEHAETGYTVSLQCQNFRISGKSVKQLNIMSSLDAILTQGELTASVVDSKESLTILLMTGVKMQSRQSSVDARGVMTETWSFVGRKATDEFEASQTANAPAS